VITKLQDVLTVPIQAVTTLQGKQVCFIQGVQRPTAVPVEIGMFNDRLIEIRGGLKEGDQVLLSPLAMSDKMDLSESVTPPTSSTNTPATPAKPLAETKTEDAKSVRKVNATTAVVVGKAAAK
jgi:hypothetical protein